MFPHMMINLECTLPRLSFEACAGVTQLLSPIKACVDGSQTRCTFLCPTVKNIIKTAELVQVCHKHSGEG